MTPSGISQRTQWLNKYKDYQEKFIAARDAYLESLYPASRAPDGMPHGSVKSDPVAKQSWNHHKAYMNYCYARDARDVARTKRFRAMRKLNDDQKQVLQALYFQHKSRRALAAELGRSDFWVRAQERTGLLQLELPPGWENDILP